MLNRKKHARLWTPRGAMTANERLVCAVVNGTPIVIRGRKMVCTQCHYGPGFWQKNFGVIWDSHDDLQIQICLSGNFDFQIEEKKCRLKPGCALAIASHKPHAWKTPTGGFMLGLYVRAHSPDGEAQTLRLRKGASFDLTESEKIAPQLQALAELTEKKDFSDYDEIRLQSWLTLLITEILDSVLEPELEEVTSEAGSKSLRHAFVIRNVTEEIEKKISETLRIEDLARNAGVSVRHLNRLFAQIKGESIHRFIVNQRVLKARQILEKNPDLPIKAVAMDSGFSDASHLGNAFRRHFHISPGRFAESLRR